MHAIEAFLGRPEVERLGWVLLHFVWQGAIAAGLLAAAVFLMRRASANARYLTACAALAAMAVCLPVTWLLVPQRPAVNFMEPTGARTSLPLHAAAVGQTDPVSNRIATELEAPAPSDVLAAPTRPTALTADRSMVDANPINWREKLTVALPWLAAVWLVCVLVLSIRLAIGWTTVRRLRRAGQPAADDKQAALARLAARLGIRSPVKLLESALVEVPTMIGWLRPAVLWPPSMLTGLSIDQFESLLAHELAHIRRHDYLVNLAQTAIETLLFYHPAVWWVSSRIRHERECCCDDLAVATCGNRLSYARALTRIEELRSTPRQFALASDGGRLLVRIRRIVGGASAARPAPRYWLAGALVLAFSAAAVGLSARAALQGDDERPPAKPPEKNIAAPQEIAVVAPKQPLLTRVLSGLAVDAETGQPVQGFVYELATFDQFDSSRFHWNGEAIAPGSQKDGAFGIVVKNHIGQPVWARIVAPGYVQQPISEKPIVLAADSVLDKFEVKMHRGKTLAGRVVDSAGNPVANAGVYLLRNQGSRQVVRDPAAGPHQQFEMLAVTNTRTDADGRFKMTGWDAESGRVAVMSGEMNLWIAPTPAQERAVGGLEAAEWTIHLPKPAAIECLVDNDRGESNTLYDLDFITTGRMGWEMLRAYQFSLSSEDGKLSIVNHTPGQYELTRRRPVKVGDYEGEFKLAAIKLQVDPSNTFTVDLRHPDGWPIAGQIAGLKELGLSGAVISVEPPGEVKRGQMTFDATTCGEGGRFETGRLAPGKYRVHVDAYLPKKQADPRVFGGGLNLPDTARPPAFTADVEVTIAKDQQPENLKIELKKGGASRAFRELLQYHEQPHPAAVDEFTAPPWAAVAATEDPAKNGNDNSNDGAAKARPKPTTPDTEKPAKAPVTEYKPITIYGQVIDDETGKPVTLFDTQGGRVDEKDPKKVEWGYWLRPNSGGSEGRFDVNVDWNAGWRARVVASGYLPQPILTEAPKPGQDKVEGLVVRLKRGRAVHGRVVDHADKPVKDAALFVVGSRPLDITGGQALMNGAHGEVEDGSAGRHSTDADGKFTLTGIGEDAKNIAISCSAVDLWIVPAPETDEAAKNFEIRLPEPGKLIVHYGIPGGPEETTIFLQLHTWDREGWKGVDNRRRPTVRQHGELVLDNMTPGLYEVVRDSGGFLDRRQVTIEPGTTVTSDFIRKAGAPITGRVVGLDREEVLKAKPTHINISVHKPGDERNPIAPKFASVQISPFDKDGKPSDGSFKTEIIPPGEYLVRASVFIEETPEQRNRTGIIPPGFEGEAKVTVPEQGAPPPIEIQLKKWQYKPFEFKKPADAPKKEAPKEGAGESPDARGSNRLSEPPAHKAVDDVVKQGLQAIGDKQSDDEATKASVAKALLYLAKKQAEEATAGERVNEVKITVDPALAAELRALDAMRAGLSTQFDKVDEAGRKLLEKYQKPEEQGQIYFMLLQVHGQSGLRTPNRIISYAQQALKYPLGSRQELMVYIYWGDTLNVQKTEKTLPEQRPEAAAVYLKGLKLTLQYPETPPAVPDPPPISDDPDDQQRAARQKAWEHYEDLRNKADFIKEVNYHRAIFIRQIADMYHRLPAATAAEVEALRKQATEVVQNDAAVARLMAAVDPDGATKAGDAGDKPLTKAALEALAIANAKVEPQVPEDEIDAAISKDPRIQQAVNELNQLTRQQQEIEKIINNRDDSAIVRLRDAIKAVRDNIEEIKKEDREKVIEQAQRSAGKREESRWSKAVEGVEARLSFEHGRVVNGTQIIATYLELRNVSDSATPIEIRLDPSKIEFKVLNAKGEARVEAGLPYDGMTALPGTLRLPHDSQIRLGVSGNGAGIPKDGGALLDVASSSVWLFKPGETGEYRLKARFMIAESSDRSWHGTIEVPPARIPLPLKDQKDR